MLRLQRCNFLQRKAGNTSLARFVDGRNVPFTAFDGTVHAPQHDEGKFQLMYKMLNGRDALNERGWLHCACHIEHLEVSFDTLLPGDVIVKVPDFYGSQTSQMEAFNTSGRSQESLITVDETGNLDISLDDSVVIMSSPEHSVINISSESESFDREIRTSTPELGVSPEKNNVPKSPVPANSGISDNGEHTASGYYDSTCFFEVLRIREGLEEVFTHPRQIQSHEVQLRGCHDPIFNMNQAPAFSHPEADEWKPFWRNILLDNKPLPPFGCLFPHGTLHLDYRSYEVRQMIRKNKHVVYQHITYENWLGKTNYKKVQELFFEFTAEEFVIDVLWAVSHILENDVLIRRGGMICISKLSVSQEFMIEGDLETQGLTNNPNHVPGVVQDVEVQLSMSTMNSPLHIVQVLLHEMAHVLCECSFFQERCPRSSHDRYWVNTFAYLISRLHTAPHGEALHALRMVLVNDLYPEKFSDWEDLIFIWPNCIVGKVDEEF